MKPGSSKDLSSDALRPIGARPLSDADYRQMVDAVTDYAIFALDINGVIRSWNAGARRLKGYEAEEVIGQHFSKFYPQELKDRHWPEHELSEALRLGRFEDEGWRVRKDGRRFWANIIITRLTGPSGEVRGFSKITRDLTDRRQQEERLRISEERFRLLIESVKDYAIFMLDPSGHVVSWNPGAEKNKGYTESEILGKHFSVFYPEDTAKTDAPAAELETALKTGKFEDEGWRVRKDGTRFWAGVVLTAIFDEQGRHRGFAKVTRDLTEIRKASLLEDEGRRITTFLAMLGHELRNPLAPMVNAVSVMRTENLEPSTCNAALGVFERQLKQMARLVDDLLDVSRIASGKIRIEMKPVRLRDVMAQAVEGAEPLVKQKSHLLTVDNGKADVWVMGDRARLIQLITNLLNNAAKFTPDKGRIDLALVNSLTTAEAEIRLKDNGPGIPAELRSDIFNLFVQGQQTVAHSHGGLGLGLPLSRQLAVLHGGDVEVYSGGLGEGAEFVVRLPTTAAPAESTRASDAGGRKRILVVDDNRDAAFMLSLLVQSFGYETTVVHEGLEALKAVLADAPDLVLLDLGLPDLGGLEVARRIGAEVVNPPPLIAISGYGQDSDREATYKAGFHAHFSKPVDTDELKVLLKRLFA